MYRSIAFYNMFKVRKNLRNVIAGTICLTTVTVFLGCGKDDKEPPEPVKDPLTYDEGVVINGVKWATRNVGAPGTFVAKPEDAGMFYQWNSKVGWSSIDPLVNSNGGIEWIHPWKGGFEVPSENDVWETANNVCPDNWRVPTVEEQKKLLEVNSEWTSVNSIEGRRFGNGNNTIFVPAAGHRFGENATLHHSASSPGSFWSSTANGKDNAYNIIFSSDTVRIGNTSNRDVGSCIRCVAK